MTNAQNEAHEDVVSKPLPAGLGAVPASMKAKLTTVDLVTEIPCVVPGKPGFDKGVTLAGYYLRTERVYSPKFTSGKKEADGRKYRDLHSFKDANGNMFGIWSVGILGYTLSRVNPNTFLAITYEGISEVPLRAHESCSHLFKFEGIDIDQNIIAKN